MSTIRIFCLSRATAPITHMAGSEGNESIVAREPVMHDGNVRRVPYLSGNALRACCVRQPGMRWLIARYGLAGKLTLPQLNFLLHGGALTESTGREDVARIAEMHASWPLLKCLGGCLPDQIIQAGMLGCPGVLVCEENRDRVASLLPEGFALPDDPLSPAESFVRNYQYVTFDTAAHEPELLPPKAADGAEKPRGSDDVRMMYTGQAVMPGALFVHDFLLRYARPEDAGAVLWSLALWQESGGVAGGMGAKGHGRLATSIHVTGCEQTAESLIELYQQTAGAMQERALAWLTKAFAAKDKPAKAGKGRPKKGAAKPEPVGVEE